MLVQKRVNWVNQELEKHGFKFVSGDIKDLKYAIGVECLKCQTHRELVFTQRKRRKCQACGDITKTKKLLADVVTKSKNIGYEILEVEGEYENTKKTYLNVRCLKCKKHERRTTFSNLLDCSTCTVCRQIKFIKSKLKKHGYKFIDYETVKYDDKTNFYKVAAECQKGHPVTKILSGFDKPCLDCNPKEPMWNYERVADWLLEHRPHLKLLAYDTNSKRASLQCTLDGFPFAPDWSKFYSAKDGVGHDCPKCSNSAPLTIEEIRKPYLDAGWKVEVDENTNTRSDIVAYCPKGHKNEKTNLIRFRDRGDRCLTCFRQDKASKGEKELLAWMSENYQVESHNREILDGLEIDGYIPEHKLGIEYHGLYFHSQTMNPHNLKNREKFRRANAKGVKLLQFWEDEWLLKSEIVKSMILVNLNSPDIKRIYARMCSIEKVDTKTAKEFLEENHLQGYHGANALGLYYKYELVMLVSYGKHHRGGTSETVLQRVASKKMLVVVGGLSKLVAKLPRPLITWSDNRYSTGNAYLKSGFSFDCDLRPDYQYFRNEGRYKYIRYSKQSLKKTPEERLTGKTESELRRAENYHKIYDAGKKRWRLD